jgi:uncharacterized membrane protein HdeD (DUF308 family)
MVKPMSRSNRLDFTTLTTYLAGILLLSTGGFLIYNTLSTEASSVKPWLFTPVGILLIVVGLLMLLSKEDLE